MAAPTLADIQILIDTLFAKLDKAGSGGELTRFQHALRIHITRKRSLGGKLDGRERELLDARGAISAPRGRHPLLALLVVIALVVAAVVLHRRFSPVAADAGGPRPAPPADTR